MTNTDSLRIVVTGLAATYPFGGVFWDYLQYPLGFALQGHSTLYLEDTGKWCYSPTDETFVETATGNVDLLARRIARWAPELTGRWFVRDATGTEYGWRWKRVVEFCRSADLFLHISASCWMRPEYFEADVVAFLDSDPMYTQASVPAYVEGTADAPEAHRVEELLEHDVFFSFGENIGRDGCLVPTELFDWIPTRQPIVIARLKDWRIPLDERRKVFTTVASWEPHEDGPVVRGLQYAGKSVEFERFIGVAARSPVPLELAVSGRPPVDRLRAAGWVMRDALGVSGSPEEYMRYLANSYGEWSVAKNAYVASESGWFSCRSACYLALGVPVVVQSTGFERVLPTGKGLVSFTAEEEALEGISSIMRDPEQHSRAARELAHEYFHYDKVLSELTARAQ